MRWRMQSTDIGMRMLDIRSAVLLNLCISSYVYYTPLYYELNLNCKYVIMEVI